MTSAYIIGHRGLDTTKCCTYALNVKEMGFGTSTPETARKSQSMDPCDVCDKVKSILKPEGISSELADIVICAMDLCGRYGIDLQAAIDEKTAYNRTRPYRHGKAF